MANPWFRLYSRVMTDPKIELLSFEDQRHFVWILCMKNEGYLDENYPTPEARERVISRKLGTDSAGIKERLVEVGLIDDQWQPVSWDELQFKSDSSKNRVRAYRERKKKQSVTLIEGNEVTECNVTVTPQDTDTDTDTDKSKSAHKKPRSRFCPDDWSPNPVKLRTARIPKGVDVGHELAKFRTFEFKTPRSDWDRAFANWLASAEPRKNDGLNKLERANRDLLGTFGQGQGGMGGNSQPVAPHDHRPNGSDPRLVASHRRIVDGGD